MIDCREKKLVIDLGDNYSSQFSEGKWTIGDQRSHQTLSSRK